MHSVLPFWIPLIPHRWCKLLVYCYYNIICIFIDRNEKNQLLLGIRRASRPQTVMPSSVLSSDSMHIGLLAAAAHAAATNSCFTVFFNPRLFCFLNFYFWYLFVRNHNLSFETYIMGRASPSEFVIPLSKYIKAVYHTRVSVGMRFRMLFETEESSVRRYLLPSIIFFLTYIDLV